VQHESANLTTKDRSDFPDIFIESGISFIFLVGVGIFISGIFISDIFTWVCVKGFIV